MLDFLPWMDEVHIVEMGRNFLSPASAADGTILSLAGGQPFIPLYYIGPVFHEVVFRLFGEAGVRLSPVAGAILAAVTLAWFLKSCGRYSRFAVISTFLLSLTLPLLVQSTRLVRIDSWLFAICFATCGLLSRKMYKTAALIAALSPFVWPSAAMLAPMYLMVHVENRERHARLVIPAILGTCMFAILLIPLLHVFSIAAGSLSYYFATYSSGAIAGGCFDILGQCKSLIVPIAKETLRAPFFLFIAYTGVALSLWKRKVLFTMFLAAVFLGVATGMHTFRYIYLMPYFLVFAADAIEHFHEKLPKATMAAAALAIAYGFACGPLAYAIADLSGSPDRMNAAAAEVFKDAPAGAKVFTPGYSTYYALRALGLTQVAIAEQSGYSDEGFVSHLLKQCNYALVETEDKYAAIEESYTLYGLLRDFCLEKARIESACEEKSLAGKIGEAFAYGTKSPVEDAILKGGFTMERQFSCKGKDFSLYKRIRR